LRVGPQSAGARPGPACYGVGGKDATVTDAFLYLGYLNPDFFLGGRMTIQPALSAEAIRKNVAEPFGMSLDEAAFSVFRIINSNLSNGIRYVSVAEGHDPRDFALMSFGGAGSVTVGIQARDLGVGRVLVPRTASVFCALGELLADLRISQLHATPGRLDTIDPAALSEVLDMLAAGPRREIEAVDGVEQVRLERHAEMRYAGQVHELPTPMVENTDFRSAMTETVRAFHALHKQRYAFEMPQKPVEMLSVRQDVIGSRQWTVPRHALVSDPDASAAIKTRRKVCFPDGQSFVWLETPIYDGALLRPGHRLVGPAIIEEVDTTIAVQPGDRVLLNEFQVYDINIGDAP
jgi:N-methylhydantoinase A